jgi:cell wall-associated NlpC family hydrolase
MIENSNSSSRRSSSMNRLKIIILFSLFTIVISSAFGYHNCVFADASGVGIYIDGTAVDFPDVKPYISNDRTFVPVRFISEQLGASVSWNSDTGEVIINKGNDSIKLVIGSTEVIKNGVLSSMDAVPMITDGRTMVPLRFVSEQLGTVVNWDVSNNSVLITTAKSNPDYTVYTVKAGDTLWQIALTYGVSMGEISEENPGLNLDKLTIGQQLNLPAASAVTEPPTVSRGGGRTVSLNCTADELIEYAEEYLGVPYAYGGTTPDGFDCSGFTQYVAAHFDGYLPHSSSEQYHYGISIEKEDLQPGDLVFFEASDDSKEIGHVGMYIGDGKFIHAPQSGGNVEISNLSNVYFDRHYYGAIRMDIEDAK